MRSAQPDGAALTVDSVSRHFAGVRALEQVSLAIAPGEVLGLLGPNGAGKSTLVNIISGYDRPDSGTVRLGQRDVTGMPAWRRATAGIARTFQQGHLFAALTVQENIMVPLLAGGIGRADAWSAAVAILESHQLTRWSETAASELPHGVSRRVGVARAEATGARCLLLDEPAAGLDRSEAEEFGGIVRRMAGRGYAVLLIDHNFSLMMAVSARVHVLAHGATVLTGTPAEVRESAVLSEIYLGRSSRA